MLNIGAQLGPYEILAPLGAGGMGEVYRARDARLGRDVAVKVLPERFISSPDFRQRFEREARAISSLQHPHICVLYDVGHDDTAGEYLVMEFLEGETVADRLKRGKLPFPELLKIGMQIADALDKAHRKGVIHRDLKPANIMLTKTGSKLMDFGLAKAAVGASSARPAERNSALQEPGVSAPLLSAALTLSSPNPTNSPLTSAGSIVGTMQYMSPEQIQGKDADARSDIFALGAVLYEMATGKRAFTGKSQLSVATAILENDPAPVSSVQPALPPALDALIGTCLAKDPEERFANAHDVGVALKWISTVAPVSAPAAESRVGTPALQRALPWAVVAASLLVVAALAIAYFGRPSPAPPVRALIAPPDKVRFAFNPPEGAPTLSPDGARLVYPATDASGKEALWVRRLDSLSAQRLEGTEGADFPFWSPDSRYIGFFQDGKLKKIDVTGGPPVLLCEAESARGGAWGRDVIAFAPHALSGLLSVPVAGGTPTPLASPSRREGNFSNRWPAFLPDGRHFLFLSGDLVASGTSKLGIFVGEVGSDKPQFLIQADSDAQYAPPGYLVFLRGDTLMAQAFDAGSLKLKGEAFPVAEHIASPLLYRLGLFSVSQTGLLVYESSGGEAKAAQLSWFDESGKQLGTLGQPGATDPWISPDGKHVAYSALDEAGKSDDIWLADLARGVQTRFTFGPSMTRYPVWSPDGTRIAYTSLRQSEFDIFVKDASGAGKEEILVESEASKFASDWSPDGRYILFSALAPRGRSKYGIWVMPLFGDRKPYPYLQTEFNQSAAVFSPGGRWVAYQSDESGSYQVYLSPFPAGGGKYQVSQGGGVQPMWKHDGSALYYLAPDGKLMEVNVKEKGSAVEIGAPQPLFQQPTAVPGANDRGYSVAPDGKRFLVSKTEQGSSPPLVLVTNWTADLKK